MNRQAVALICLMWGASLQVVAKPPLPYAPSPVELSLLPKACQFRLGPGYGSDSSRPTVDAWANRVGGREVWSHIHHFCHGLKFMNRAQATLDSTDRRFNLQSAVGEFDYVLDKWPPQTPLRDEARARKEEALLLLRLK